MSCEGASAPQLLRWGTTSLTNDGLAVAYGLQVGIGSPPQLFAITPNLSASNIRVSNAATCGGSVTDACIGSSGGVMNTDSSATYRGTSYSNWNGTHTNLLSSTGANVYFNDVLQLGNGSLYGLPMVLRPTLSDGPSQFPLFPKSIVLQQGWRDGLLPSTSWSMQAGSTDVVSQQYGTVILGGYSLDFVDGPMYTIPAPNPNPHLVRVVNVTCTMPNGTIHTLLSPQGGAFNVSLESDLNTLILPPTVFDSFAQLTNATVGNGGIAVSSIHQTSVASMDITIATSQAEDQPGLKTTIPYSSLYQSPAPASIIVHHNDTQLPLNLTNSSKVALIQRGKSDNATFFLGYPYLSQVYLIRNNENQTISLGNTKLNALANPTVTAICASKTPATASSEASPSHAGDSRISNAEHLRVQAIVGAVTGGLAILVLTCIIVFIVSRRQRRWGLTRISSLNSAIEKDAQPRRGTNRRSQAVEAGTCSDATVSLNISTRGNAELNTDAENQRFELEGDFGPKTTLKMEIPRSRDGRSIPPSSSSVYDSLAGTLPSSGLGQSDRYQGDSERLHRHDPCSPPSALPTSVEYGDLVGAVSPFHAHSGTLNTLLSRDDLDNSMGTFSSASHHNPRMACTPPNPEHESLAATPPLLWLQTTGLLGPNTRFPQASWPLPHSTATNGDHGDPARTTTSENGYGSRDGTLVGGTEALFSEPSWDSIQKTPQ